MPINSSIKKKLPHWQTEKEYFLHWAKYLSKTLKCIEIAEFSPKEYSYNSFANVDLIDSHVNCQL